MSNIRLIDANALKEEINELAIPIWAISQVQHLIDNAPTIEYTFEEAFQKTVCEKKLYCPERPQGEIVDSCDMNLFEPEKYMKGGTE